MKRRWRESENNGNRAEQVRHRREERSQKRTSAAGSRVVRPVRKQPVTVRGNLFGKPVHQSAGTRNARRQFYVAMDAAGTELRLPAVPVLRPGWRLLSSLIAILMVAAIYLLWTSPLTLVENVQINGLERLTAEEILQQADLNNLVIVEIDPRAVEETLRAAFPGLVEVKASVAMPNLVTVEVVERQPVAVWYRGDDANWLDAEGTIFPIHGEAGPLLTLESDSDLPAPPLPVEELMRSRQQDPEEEVSANTGFLGLFAPKTKEEPVVPQEKKQDKVDPAFLQTAQELSQKIPPETTILYDPQNGLGWYDAQGWQVYIGRDLSTFDAKFAMYARITQYLNEQGLQPSLVSVEHLNAPFYQLEQ